ncbi:MAG: hypothetical protein P4L40_25655, partial [Terracidiphilus sp.]|nr:hypothetical protein [Terracidiphilus sp.]
AAGHDVTAQNNRIVSCGVTANGQWYAIGRPAAYIWNYYNSNAFYNNTITTTSGGMVDPGTNDAPYANDLWVNSADAAIPSISASGNDFSDPCLTSSGINLQAEQDERTYWAQKIAAAGQAIGDQHLD